MNEIHDPAPFADQAGIAAHARIDQSAPPTTAPWGPEVRRILCIRPDNMGDVIMTGPAIAALRRGAPGRHITLLASGAGALAARFIPEIDEVLRFDPPWARHDDGASPDATREAVARLAAGGYDAAVIFTVYSQNPLPAAMLCYQAGIPRRLGYCRENPYALLNDWVRETEPHLRIRHEVARQLDLVAQIGAHAPDPASRRMRFVLAAADHHALDEALARANVASRKGWIVVHPGATAASRRYPPERFAEVAAALAARGDRPVLITGAAGERELVEAVHRRAVAMLAAGERDANRPGTLHALAGQLEIGAFGALLARAALLVTNNSGPVHIGAALGTPIVDLYALTNPQHTPWATPHRLLFHDVPCRWCYKSQCPEKHHACLLGVAPSAVVDAALDLLAETRSLPDPADHASLASSVLPSPSRSSPVPFP